MFVEMVFESIMKFVMTEFKEMERDAQLIVCLFSLLGIVLEDQI